MKKAWHLVMAGLLFLGALPFGLWSTSQTGCGMSCCRLGKPGAACQLQLTMSGGCDHRTQVSVADAPPSVLPEPVRVPGTVVSGRVAAAVSLPLESASPRLFDPPPRG